MPSPEELAREKIDPLLQQCGWILQNRSTINLSASSGVALCEALLKDRDEVDYLLFVDGKAIGTVEAKPEGHTLTGVEEQSDKYGKGLLDIYPKWREPLPFAYESTGVETQFTNQLDPSPKSRNVFAFHRPETLLEYLEPEHQLNTRLAKLLTTDHMPKSNLWSAQIEAIRNLEKSLAANKRRALIQMATGSGKTYTAVNFVYRLIKLAGARRVLFLVDRGNLGDQTLKEFQQFVTPDDGRKFTELYNVQHLQSAQLDRVSRVCISTIQRLYSMLREFVFVFLKMDTAGCEQHEEIGVALCAWHKALHRVENGAGRVAATSMGKPGGRMSGSERVKGFYVDKRNRLTRKVRWEQLDEDLAYAPNELTGCCMRNRRMREIGRRVPSLSSCSQMRITPIPWRLSNRRTRRSRRRLLRSFASQNRRCTPGTCPHRAQPCQKQPSTKTATPAERKKKSGRPATSCGESSQPATPAATSPALSFRSVVLFPCAFTLAICRERF